MQYTYKLETLPKSEIQISVEINADSFKLAHQKALQRIKENLEIDGFRKGFVPEKIVLEKVGEATILEEAGEVAINEALPKIFEEIKKDVIGRPAVSLTKIALGSPLEFKVKIAVMPEYELPDYKKIAKEVLANNDSDEDLAVSQKEIDDVILQIRKNKAHFDWHQAHPEEKGHDGPARTADAVQSGGHPDLEKEENLPVFDDEFAKSAGNFKSAEELKEKIKENIVEEKKIRNQEKKRVAIMEKLVAATKVEIPDILIESETAKSIAQMKDDVERAGLEWEKYLAETKKIDSNPESIAKAEKEIRDEMRAGSLKKATIQLIFNKIAEIENVKLHPEILENEVKNILAHYPGASEENARIYVETLMTNSEVLKILDSQKTEK